MAENAKLRMTFDPNTIQHLGIKMYSNLPAAIAELVANAYDADAHHVTIRLTDTKDDKCISVEDDGDGMSFNDINDCFLKIGRNRRDIEKTNTTRGGRKVTGKKGLGKLALFGIGIEIGIKTHKKGTTITTDFVLNWDELKNCHSDYTPRFQQKRDATPNGYTIITISKLKRKTGFDSDMLASSLAKMFNFLDASFEVIVKKNNTTPTPVNNALRFSGVDTQFEWQYPAAFKDLKTSYSMKTAINGKIITSVKPLKPNLRGITLFAHGRLANLPEFFGRPVSSHFFSYATGWLNVDFVDDGIGDDDLISTNRQSLDWEKDESIELRVFLQELLAHVQNDWREKRKELNKKEATDKSGIDRDEWLNTLPKKKADLIAKILDSASDPENVQPDSAFIEQTLHEIVPEYAELHWRFLNSAITTSSSVERLYKTKNYFQAASEAVKQYLLEVKKVSNYSGKSETTMMTSVFGRKTKEEGGNTPVISLTERTDVIEEDIEEGQKWYSAGVVTGFKNPVTSHCTEDELKARGLFSEKDCLDILSLLSHLFDRLNNRKEPTVISTHGAGKKKS